MAGSKSSNSRPAPRIIEAELRKIVYQLYVEGNLEELTVKRVRLSAEKNLGLEEGFFKERQWKDKSKSIIESEATAQEIRVNKSPHASQTSPPKRKSEEPPQSAKRQKLGSTGPTTEDASKTNAMSSNPSSSELSEAEDVTTDTTRAQNSDSREIVAPDLSESEMSEVIDDEPKPKHGSKRSSGKEKKVSGPIKRRKKEPPEMDPDTAEIKRLQGWLLKCGVRKMWARELKPYGNPKAKIKHLRDMLADIGMTGRFSAEKAKQIREARELQADLEAVQEGNKYWGKKESDSEEDIGTRPKRRLAQGLQELAAFGDSESD